MTQDTTHSIPRRGLLVGAGAAALGATLIPHEAASAAEKPHPSAVDGPPKLSPVPSTIASPAVNGFIYRHVSWLDFQPESGPATRQYGGRGAYSSGSSPYLWATVEIPPGALVRDIEWYVYNNSGTAATALGRLWAAGTGTLFASVADTPVASTDDVVARRTVISSTFWGPHPIGTKLALGLSTTSTGTVQVNGARVGFSRGAGTVGLLPAPVRAYDSQETGGRLSTGSTRVITIPAALAPTGTTGILTNITVTGGTGGGHITVFSGDASKPSASTIHFVKGQTISNAVTVGLSPARKVKVYASRAVHVIVDVTGTIS